MRPNIVVYYVRSKFESDPGTKIAKAAFVNEGDALIYWNALPEKRKRYLVMETIQGDPVTEIAHSGWNDYLGCYGHAYALTDSDPLPPRARDREQAVKSGWEFTKVNPGVSV